LTSRERVIKALNFEGTDRVPRSLWKLYGVLMMREDEFDEVNRLYDFDTTRPPFKPGDAEKQQTGAYCEVGKRTDPWGVTWVVGERGVSGEAKGHPLADWSALEHYKPPYELIDGADLSETNRFAAETTKFIDAGSGVNPFERLQFLRGPEATYVDLAYGTKEIFKLLEMIHDYSCRAMRMWAGSDVDMVSWMDDWGAQSALLISPDMWRDIFKPLYRDYVDILREKGKYTMFHSDGFIEPIIPDMIEIGVHAVNAQLFCMDIEKLGREYGGKILFYGGMDRQYLLPFGTTEEVREGVRRWRRALDHGKGGVVAGLCWGLRDPIENVIAFYDEWEKPRVPSEDLVTS